jgi:hypothetical protein
MNCENINSLLLEYLDDNLNPIDRVEVENHLAGCSNCSNHLEQFKTLNKSFLTTKKVESTQSFKSEFFNSLENEKAKAVKTGFRLDSIKSTLKVAASILLFVSGTIFGLIIQNQGMSKTKITTLENEVISLKQQVALGMLNEQQTASEKLQAINYAFEQNDLNKEIALALYNTLISDENSSVRLETAITLQRFSNDDAIKRILIKSLEYQSDPFVQIKLIQILSSFNENESKEALKIFFKQENLNPVVMDYGQKML